MSAGGIFMIGLVVIFVVGVITRGNFGNKEKADWRDADKDKTEETK